MENMLTGENIIRGKPVKPRCERSVAAKVRQLMPRSHEDFFRQLRAAFAAAGQASAKGVDPPEVPSVQPLKRLVVARGRECDIL
jgi:hypothetical protein